MKPPRIVIDTNVIVSALRSRHGASARLLSLLGTELFTAHLSVPLVVEYEDVLMRQRSALDMSAEAIMEYVDALCAVSEHHDIHYLWRPFLRDVADEFVLDVAVAANCDYIVTYNLKDFVGVAKFGIEALAAKEFLLAIGAI